MHRRHVDANFERQIDQRGHQQRQRYCKHQGNDAAMAQTHQGGEKGADQKAGGHEGAQHSEINASGQKLHPARERGGDRLPDLWIDAVGRAQGAVTGDNAIQAVDQIL